MVWNAVQMKLEREQMRVEYLAAEAERFKTRAFVKRRFGEKKKTNKKRLQISGLALAKRKRSPEAFDVNIVCPNSHAMTRRRPIRVIRNC